MSTSGTSHGRLPSQRYEYASVADCPGSVPGAPTAGDFCAAAVAACAGNTAEQGTGPSVRIYRRPVTVTGTPTGPWVDVGATCFATTAGRPVLGLAQVQQAFRQVVFARPTVSSEPRGEVTLVGLPTFFAVSWPSDGLRPGEVDRPDPARMLGHRVELQPVLDAVTYVFGDGTGAGPTRSLGGPHPTGAITHRYRHAGGYPVRADVTYTGRYRVDGGPWLDVPGTVTVRGTSHTLTVRAARARLYGR